MIEVPLPAAEAPGPADLEALLARADGYALCQRNGATGEDAAPFHAGADLDALRAALRLAPPGGGFRCMCRGDLAVRLSAGGRELATLGLHHGVSLRLEGWGSDARLAEPRALAAFLDGHGLPGHLAAWEAGRARARVSSEAWERGRAAWLGAAPPALRSFAEGFGVLRPPKHVQDELLAALARAEGGPFEARRALLRWAAFASQDWEQYPAHEALAVDLLGRGGLDADLERHLAAAQGPEWAGLGRYVVAWGLAVAGAEAMARALTPERRAALLEAAQPFDPLGRLARRLEPEALRLRVPEGAELLHAFRAPRCYAACFDGARFWGIDDHTLVRFDPGRREPLPVLELARDGRAWVSASPGGVVAHDGPEVFTLGPGGERRPLARLRHPPDALVAGAAHVAWVTNSDPGNPAGRTYALERIPWAGGEIEELMPPGPHPPYGLAELEGSLYALRRTTVKGWLGRSREAVGLFRLAPGAAPELLWTANTATLLDVTMAAQPAPSAEGGEEPPALWVAEGRSLHRFTAGGRHEKVEIERTPRRLAATSRGPVYLTEAESHLRIEQQTVVRATRYVLDLPPLPWPAALLGHGDHLYVSVGPAILRTRI